MLRKKICQSTRGRPYQRVGPTTSLMPQERYQRLLLDRIHSRHRWENAPAEDIGVEDLDHEEILRTVRLGIAAGRLPESTGTSAPDVLDRLGLRREGLLLNASIVLFGIRFLPYDLQCQLRLARFKGIDKTEFLDQNQMQGHAFRLLEEAVLFLRRHLPVAGRIQPGLFEREDEPLFPLAALREALVNALCHRDYTLAGGAVSLAIYDDRLEIWSDGTLPFGLKVDDLKRDHRSRPRNPLIAEVFHRRGLVERWGRGTQKIVELCVKAGHPEPEFVEQAGAVGVRFLPRGYIAPHRVTHDLTERQREVLYVLAQAPRFAFRDLRARLNQAPPDRTLREDLIHLKRLGLIGSQGHGRGAVWFLQREGVKKAQALDTGATGAMVNVAPLATIGYDPSLVPDRVQVTTGSGVEFAPRIWVSRIKALGQERGNFPVLAHTLPPSASIDGVLGLDFLRAQVLNIDFRQGTITLS